MTLIRNVIMELLNTKLKCQARAFISSEGSTLFMVVKATEQMLMNEAARKGINKELELGAYDLFSLEPVDDSFRPLRANEYLRNV